MKGILIWNGEAGAAFLCGTEGTKYLAAVNNDKNAPIFLSAETGIVDGCMGSFP